ncbi:MAG: choice-of-anchor J domain-containing protein [Bacteroidaceae bacterium]|nr:choice-of-anchor J domain-containing protein [Bacteroidaceae bacterium]
MKLKNLFLAALGLFALSACTDTPDSPYDFPTGGGNSGTTEEGVYINASFKSDFGTFTPVETVGSYPWIIDYGTAKATSYDSGTGTNNAATSWLISAPIDFTDETEAYVAFDYIIRYSESGKVAANHQLLISSDYAGDAAAATWKDLPYNAVEGSDWATFYKANVTVPADFLGKSGIVFALRYTATTKASTWEVKNFKVAHGTAAEPEEPEEAEEYTVSEALAAFTGVAKPAVVKGYVVGTVDGQVYTDGCRFSGSAETMTNILIADNADETDNANCMPVQLPSGAVRNALNLVDNPGNYKKLVTLTGSLEKYFGVPGLKTVTKYAIDGVTPEEPETPADAYISETFATDFGAFTTQETVGNFPWVIDYSCAKVTGYESASKVNYAAESWLVSPAIDFTNEKEAYISFDYVIRYTQSGKVADFNQVLVSTDYAGDVATATWKAVNYNPQENTADWTFRNSGKIALPAELMGKANVTVAFKYTSTDTKAGTWEVKNVTVASGSGDTPEEPETPDTPVVPSGENLLANGSFEDWNGNKPAYWATLSTSNATIAQSTEARSGNYSVAVSGTTSNKRFASQSYVLAPGTYTFSAYVKNNGADAGHCRLGYAKIVNGTAAEYKYETPVASEGGTEWSARVYEFTLTEQTELALVIMNNKTGNGASFLVDDASLTTADGYIVGGDSGNEDDNEEPETPAETASFTAVTSITSGAQYLIVAGTNQAIALDATKSYGYLPVTTVSPANGVINTTADNTFVIEAVSGGYSIKDALGRYLYMKGNYNSVNLDTTLPSEGGVWTIEFNADGTAKITNTYNGKFMQFDSQYGSYGIYPDARGQMPTLYKKN